MKVKIGNSDTPLLLDCEGACFIVTEDIAKSNLDNCDKAGWLTDAIHVYTNSQLNLHPKTVRHCRFNIITGNVAATYCFETDFYVFT